MTSETFPRTLHVDALRVEIYADRTRMGAAAGRAVATRMRELLGTQEQVRIVFAAAPSQNEFLATLTTSSGIDWPRVTAFHMDEYAGLGLDAPQGFARFLCERLFGIVRPGAVHYLDGQADPEAECARYEALLRERPIDIVCAGIGENGHLAFNDPPVADFADPLWTKIVTLEERCRQQQVNDGCFARLADVPARALTLTVPALMAGRRHYCMVPGPTKTAAVTAALRGSIATSCPASILRRHAQAVLYLDRESAAGIEARS